MPVLKVLTLPGRASRCRLAILASTSHHAPRGRNYQAVQAVPSASWSWKHPHD
jgi:hypothetical protein